MEQTKYGIGITTGMSMEAAEAAIRTALADQGFGILTEIDVKATMKEKLDIDRDEYRILGACNPALAHRALQADEHIGLLLPCNVIVYPSDAGTRVEVMEPRVMSQVSGHPELEAIADEASERVRSALAALPSVE